MDCSMPGLPVHHQLPEFTQTHVHWVGDAIHHHPLSFPPAFNLSQHQGFFKWISSLHQVPKYWSFSFNISPFNEHPGLIFLLYKDAKVWAQWNHCFDIHLSYLGPVSCIFHILGSLGAHGREWIQLDGCIRSFLSSLRAHQLSLPGGCNS